MLVGQTRNNPRTLLPTWVTAVVCLLWTALPARAQVPVDGADLRVFLVTFGPGEVIYERFGHNVICIHDPNPSARQVETRRSFDTRNNLAPVDPGAAGPFNPTDVAFHYGAFSFEQESFVWRFI